MSERTMTRRRFIESCVAAGLAAAVGSKLEPSLVETAQADEAQDTVEKVHTMCRGCIGSCGVIATVKNGRVVKVEGDPDDPTTHGAICVKGLSAVEALYNPHRNKYPMRLAGERGSNQWERLSWDEALEESCTKLMELYNKYGGETLLVTEGGGGNPDGGACNTFMNIFGATLQYEPGCAQCLMPRTYMYGKMIGGMMLTTSIADGGCKELFYPDVTPIETYVMWGTGPAQHTPAANGGAICDLRAKGVKTVVVDPRFTPDASKADVWLPIRPGTDVAMMMCWENYIIEHELYNAEFDKRWTNLPFLVDPEAEIDGVKPYYTLRGNQLDADGDAADYVVWDTNTNAPVVISKNDPEWPMPSSCDPALFGYYDVTLADGTVMSCPTAFQRLKERVAEFTIEKTSDICWCGEEIIEEAILLYATHKSGISLGVATDQHPQSAQAAMGACGLDMMMGFAAAPGALLNSQTRVSGEATGSGWRADFSDFITQDLYDKRLGNTDHKGLNGWEMSQIPAVLNAVVSEDPYPIKAWLEGSGNKLAMLGNAESWYEATKNIDFIGHLYMYPTSFTVDCCDMLFPCLEWLEYPTGTATNGNYVTLRQEVVHLFEGVQEPTWWAMLAYRLAQKGHPLCEAGFAEDYPTPYWTDLDEYINKAYCDLTGMEYHEWARSFKPYKAISDEEYVQSGWNTNEAIDEKTGLPAGFGTTSGKCEVYAESSTREGFEGSTLRNSATDWKPASEYYDPLPYFLEPEESPLTDEEYPLVMTQGRVTWYHHGTLRNVAYLREMYPVPLISMNPIDAEKYGIADQDWVKVSSRRGTVTARACVTEGMLPGVVHQERFWNPEMFDASNTTFSAGWREMNVNMLTKNDGRFSPECGTYTLRGFQVKVERTDSAPEGVWTEPEQFKPFMAVPCDATPHTVHEGVYVGE